LLANLSSATEDVQAQVEFRQDDEHTEFSLSFRGGQPNAVVEVTINGVVVLSVALDDFGNAHVEFDSDPDELGESDLPAGFPDTDAGDSVGAGVLTGNFEESDDDEADDSDDDADSGASLELEAELESETSSLRAQVEFEAETDHKELEIRVTGGVPGAALELRVGGQSLGTVTPNEFGFAKVEFDSRPDDSHELPFPAGFVAPAAGDTVTVGPLSGVLAPSTDDDEVGHDSDDGSDNENDNGADDDDGDDDDGGDDDGGDNANDNGDDENDNSDDNLNDNGNDTDDDNQNANDNGP
jgi:hypothetical protein